MTPAAAADAATLLWRHWTDRTRLDALPDACRPADRRDGYAVQAELARRSGQPVVGWKIAATSRAGCCASACSRRARACRSTAT
jgi:2-keto-4-pentenoate hydratase